MRTVEDRFDDYYVPEPNTGCWLWLGPTSSNGYGVLSIGGRAVVKKPRAHRISYERFVGAIPAGLDIDHLCRVRSCVNPAHLEPVTRKVNLARGLGCGNKRKTHCKRGHPLTGDNLAHRSAPGRLCRACLIPARKASKARARAKRRAA